jgi:CHAT domain-containing protein
MGATAATGHAGAARPRPAGAWARGLPCAGRSLLALLALLAPFGPLATLARADSGTQQVALAASGRYDQLQQLLEQEEARHALGTADRHALCFAYARTKRYDKLMPCLDQLAQSVRQGDLPTRLFGLDDATPTIYIMRADALVELGQFAAAAREAAKGLDWLAKDGSDDRDMQISCLAALSLAATLGGDRAQGQAYAGQLEKVDVSLRFADFANAKAMALGRVYMALGQYAKALEGIRSDQSFELRVFLDNLFSGATFRGVSNWAWAELPRGYMINKALLETGQREAAKAGFDRLLQIPQVRSNGEIYWLLLSDRARIAEAEDQPQLAIGLYERAIEVIEAQRATIHTEANKIGFVGNKQEIYGRLVGLLFRAGRYGTAFETIERAKSRALVDLLANKDDFAVAPASKQRVVELLERYRSASNDALAQLPIDMSADQATATTAAPSLAQRSPAARRAEELRSVAPELASLVAVSAVSLEETQRWLQPNEAIVEYYFHGADLYAVAVSGDGAHAVALEASGLEAKIRRFRQQLEQRGPEVESLAKSLYASLLQPLERYIGGADLLIVAHGMLHYLPFVALHDGKDYLVQTRALRYLPSASALKYLKPPRTKLPDAVLVLGNPDLGDKRLDLPMAEKEAQMIAALIPGSQLLVRSKASESAFKQFAPNFHYLHIASHGEFNADNALQSRLVLARSATDSGSLTVGELYDIRLDADLVTLSACETGLGTVLSGDDVVGLTRGFLYAGSSNVVATLWEVDDLATAYLMKRFYTKLKAGMAKREALRQAQVETRQEFAEPYYWAAFSITGQGI